MIPPSVGLSLALSYDTPFVLSGLIERMYSSGRRDPVKYSMDDEVKYVLPVIFISPSYGTGSQLAFFVRKKKAPFIESSRVLSLLYGT